MNAAVLTPDLTVAQVLGEYPETIRTWIAHKTDCVGCYLMKFCSLGYFAQEYHIEEMTLIEELGKAIYEERKDVYNRKTNTSAKRK